MAHTALLDNLTMRFAAAVAAVARLPEGEIDPAVRAAQDPRFGDYQCNVAMSLSRPLKAKPREIAERIAAEVDLEGIAEPLEIAGPGFINVRLLDSFVAKYLSEVPAPSSEPEAQAEGVSDEVTKRQSDDVEGTGNREQGTEAGAVSPIPDPRSLFRDRLGMAPVDSPRRVVVDYSSPNIAKQMHVGHLRSTIIGDAIARVLMFEGHHVIRQNHVGDWGTQMGQVILGVWHLCAGLSRGSPYDFNDMSREVSQAPDCRPILERIARQQQADVDGDPKGHAFEQWLRRFERGELSVRPDSAALTPAYRFVVAVESAAVPYPDIVVVDRNPDREEAVPLAFISNWTTARMLQQREPAEMLAWEIARRVSILETQATYDRLGVLLSPVDVRGESFYDDRLGPVVAELGDKSGQERGHGRAELREDGGAQCLYLYDESGRPRFKNADGDPLPMIVRKSDGAFLYATTDLAALRFRLRKVEEGGLGAQRIIYVVGAPQRLHFQMLFAAARAAGWAGDDAALEHVSFGSVLGTDNKPLKTRAGDNVKLSDLLDEAEQRARAVFADREDVGGQEDETDVAIHNPDSKIQNDEVARAVGIAAVKYFDLNRDRNKDYVFDWDRMLAMQGNTAPYMMYAYARIRSIYRKAAERFGSPDVYAPGVAIALDDPTERALAMRLARFRETIDIVAGDLSAHVLCNYLYETAAEFMRFYEACPVLQAPESLRLSRMRLCDLTARTLKLGLGLLGIEVIERM